MNPEREQFLDELAKCYARAAVDAFLVGQTQNIESKKTAKALASDGGDCYQHQESKAYEQTTRETAIGQA